MGFRTSAKTLRIDVNDDGDIVEIPINDSEWMRKYCDYLDMADRKSKEHAAAVQKEEDNILHSVLFDREMRDGFNDVFGEDAYTKVFGASLVGVEYIVEFLEYLEPFIEERVQRKKNIMNKYSADRVGGAR